MDDGSQSTTESIHMLRMQKEQGADTVIATPHFYAERESLSRFLARRQASYESLCAELPEGMPRILLGAEVRYYPGISGMADIESLCVENSRILLLEMPFSEWSEYTIREVISLSCRGNLKVALAHIDRYLSFQKKETWERLRASGILMQVNADFFQGFWKRARAISMLCNGKIHFMGSDCHNTESRPPKLCEALTLIKKKCGDDFFYRMDAYGKSFFQ